MRPNDEPAVGVRTGVCFGSVLCVGGIGVCGGRNVGVWCDVIRRSAVADTRQEGEETPLGRTGLCGGRGVWVLGGVCVWRDVSMCVCVWGDVIRRGAVAETRQVG